MERSKSQLDAGYVDPRHQWEHWAGWDPPRHPPHYSDDWPRWARAQSEPVQGMTNRVEHGSRELQPPPSEGCSRCTPRGEEIPTTVSQPYRYTFIYSLAKGTKKGFILKT